MPFCENCGNEVSDTTKFCSSCGLKIKGVFFSNQEVGSDINQRKKSANENVEYPSNDKPEDLTTGSQEKDNEAVNVEKVKNKKRWYSRWWFWSIVFCFFSFVTYDKEDINASAAYGIVVILY